MMKSTHKQSNGKSDYFSAGKPVHRLSYCAFLDILGFSERLRASYKDGSADTLLESFHQILATSIAQLRESTNDSMLYFKSFTDNVVLAHPRFSDDMESEFGFILWAINEYQFQMALKGLAVSSLKCNTGLKVHDFPRKYLCWGFKVEAFARAVV
jgi:hypothetical protein